MGLRPARILYYRYALRPAAGSCRDKPRFCDDDFDVDDGNTRVFIAGPHFLHLTGDVSFPRDENGRQLKRIYHTGAGEEEG